MKNLVSIFSFLLIVALSSFQVKAQTENLKSIAIISVDAQGISLDNLAMADLIRLELERTAKFEVLDKYDVEQIVKRNQIDPNESFGKSQLVDIGRQIESDFMLSGSVQKYGNKLVYILRLIDVRRERISKTSVKEYIANEDHLQVMSRISLADLLDMDYDQEKAAQLASVEKPIITQGQSLKLSGPRFGMQFYSGQLADRIAAPESEGGYASNPFATVFAYQQEFQYVSSGDFQVLLETIISLNGIETSHVNPSLAFLNGFRYKGWELGFGPVFRFTRIATGYYDANGSWVKADAVAEDSNIKLVENIDKRGDLRGSAGLLIAVGKTFRSGHINLPVNFYYSHSPRFNSSVVGVMLGFNIAK